MATVTQSPAILTPQTTSKRLDWVDGARVLAMMSIILQHVGAPCLWNDPLLTSSLALFFILSGYFSARHLEAGGRPSLSYLKKRLCSLLRPYIVWNLLFMIGDLSLHAMGEISVDRDLNRSIITLFCQCFGLGYDPVLVPLWFLRDLMIFNIITVFLLSKSRALFWGIALACLFIQPFSQNQAWSKPYMFGDFAIGILIAMIPGALERWRQVPLRIHQWVVCFFAIVCSLKLTPWGEVIIYDPVTPLGILALLSGGIWWSQSRFASHIAQLSQGVFFVYCFHMVVIVLFMGIQQKYNVWAPWVWWILVPVIYAICQGVYLLLNLKFPRLLRWLTLK
ncbi:MAG: acyltransferase [Akkermansia sp.]